MPVLKKIRYEGLFPKAELFYEEPSLGLDICLEVFSSWDTSSAQNSSLPGVYFSLKVRNQLSQSVKVGLLFMGRNVCGDWCVGRHNRITQEKEQLQVI